MCDQVESFLMFIVYMKIADEDKKDNMKSSL